MNAVSWAASPGALCALLQLADQIRPELKGKSHPRHRWRRRVCGISPATFPSGRPPGSGQLGSRAGWTALWGVWEWLRTFGYADFAKNVVDYPLALAPGDGMMLNRIDVEEPHARSEETPSQASRLCHRRDGARQLRHQERKATFKEMQATKGVVLVKVDGKDFDELIKNTRRPNVIAISRTPRSSASRTRLRSWSPREESASGRSCRRTSAATSPSSRKR